MRWMAGFAWVALGCGAPPSTNQDAGDIVRIGGSETLTRTLIPALTKTYARTHPDLEFQVEGGGSARGIEQLLDGDADLAASSRKVSPHEQEQAQENGYDLETASSRHIVGVDVVTITVHPSNPTNSLTYDQVIGIFCTRGIDNWSFLGQEDRPIRAITREPSSGTRALFEDFFCGPRGIHSKVEVLSISEIEQAMADDPGVISFMSLTEDAGKILALRPDNHGPAIRASQQNIIRGAYPLYHDVYLFTAGPPVDEVLDFIAWIDSPAGQEVVDEARFVPLFLRPERLDEARPLRETIHFEVGSSAPNQRSGARLQLLVEELRGRVGEYRHIVLEGYTDSREPEPSALSLARAESVRGLLQRELPGLYFELIPRGSANPIAPNDTPYGRNRNRRVQIYLAAEERDPEVVTTEEEEG